MGFFTGLRYPFRGMSFVYGQHRDLWRIWIWPIFITFVALVLAWVGSFYGYDDFVEWFWPIPEGDGFWDGVLRAIHAVFEVLVLLLLLALSSVLSLGLATVVAIPFNDRLSREVEARTRGTQAADAGVALTTDIARTVVIELTKLIAWAFLMIAVLVGGQLIPVVGQLFSPVVSFVLSALYLAFDYVDLPAGRRGWRSGRRVGLISKNFGTMLGFGAGVFALFFVPVLNLFFMPAAVAGGTLLFLEHLDEQQPSEST